jgi:hypothetical protein
MFRRSSILQVGILLAFFIAALAGLMRSPGVEATAAPPGPVQVPDQVRSDYLLFVDVNAKEIRELALFKEVKEAFLKVGGQAEWDKVLETMNKDTEIGVNLTDIDRFTFCCTKADDRAGPTAILLCTSSKPFKREGAFGLKAETKPDERGFYKMFETLVHYPDEKTVAVLSSKLADKYLDGYAKNRTAFPFTPELLKGAAGRTFFMSLRPDMLPAELKKDRTFKEYAAFLEARNVTLTGKLEGKELRLAGRASFVDATAADDARKKADTILGNLTLGVDSLFTRKKNEAVFNAFSPVFLEAKRALAAAKLEVVGSDVTASGTYSADFKLDPMVAGLVKYMREQLPRDEAQNDLKQVLLGVHNYHDVYNLLLVHGTGAKGVALKGPDEKPLLSWRVALLPFLEQGNLYGQFKWDEPWDSEHNKKLIEKMPKIYAPVGKAGKPGYTHLQMIIGPSAMRPGVYNIGTIPDGTSNTIAVVEAAEPVIWTKPDDVMFPGKELPKDFRKRFGGQFPGGFHAAMWDGSVRFVPDSVSDNTLTLAINPADGMPLGADW